MANKSQLGMIAYRFHKNKLAMFGLAAIIVMIIMCAAAPLYINYDAVIKQSMANRFIAPCKDFWFGTDQFGRDLFARIIYGGRISLLAGLIVVASALVIGVTLGGIAGYFGGTVDMVIMRICDIFMAVPRMLLAMAVVAGLGQGTFKMLIALSIAEFPKYARTVRASIMTLRNQEYVEAAKCCGTSSARIIFKHVVTEWPGTGYCICNPWSWRYHSCDCFSGIFGNWCCITDTGVGNDSF